MKMSMYAEFVIHDSRIDRHINFLQMTHSIFKQAQKSKIDSA